MALSSTLARLLHIQRLREEQSRHGFERALRQLQELRSALIDAHDRARLGRSLIRTSAGSHEPAVRLVGITEEQIALRLKDHLVNQVALSEKQMETQRESYLAARIERRQSEVLVQRSADHNAREQAARSQRDLDAWFLSRR